MWRPIQSDDYDLRYFDCDTVYTGYNKPFFEVAYGQLGNYAGYDLVSQTEVDPLPVDPDFKKTNRLWLFLWERNSRPRTLAAPACCAIVTAIRIMATILGPGLLVRGVCDV